MKYWEWLNGILYGWFFNRYNIWDIIMKSKYQLGTDISSIHAKSQKYRYVDGIKGVYDFQLC